MSLRKIYRYILLSLTFFSVASAQDAAIRGVFASGAGNSSGDKHRLRGTVGQAVIGVSQNRTYQSNVGFWYTLDRIVSDLTYTGDLLPAKFELFQNYPNPFNPVTTIGFTLPKTADVLLEVYDLLGQRIATLVKQELPAGYHDVRFGNNGLPTGIYVYRIRTGGYDHKKRMVLIK